MRNNIQTNYVGLNLIIVGVQHLAFVFDKAVIYGLVRLHKHVGHIRPK